VGRSLSYSNSPDVRKRLQVLESAQEVM